MMEVTLHLFAKARELVNSEKVILHLQDEAMSYDLLQTLKKSYPQFSDGFVSKCRLACEGRYIADLFSHMVNPEKHYVLIPPISGG